MSPKLKTLLSFEALGGSFVSQNRISTMQEVKALYLVSKKHAEIPAPSFLSKPHWGTGQGCARLLSYHSAALDSSDVGSGASSVSGV